MNRDYLKEPVFTKNGILQNVLAPNNYDGKKGIQDIETLVREANLRQFSRKLAAASTAGLVFSIFNLSRIGRLSSSGRSAAIFGTVFFTYLTYASVDRMGYFRSTKPVVEEIFTQQ